MKKVNECPVCEHADIKVLDAYKKHHLSKCPKCSMIFANVEPDQRSLEAHYAQYGRDDYFSPITKKRYQEWLLKFEKYRKTGRILDVGCGVGYF